MNLITKETATAALQAGAQNLLTAYAQLTEALAASPLAAKVTVDGTSVERADAMAMLSDLETRIARMGGLRPLIAGMDLRAGPL